MNVLWLEDFVALAHHGGFSRAADARHVTQPAFSRRIRALERWLGVELVDRDRQPIVLTTAGAWFVAVAREALERIVADARRSPRDRRRERGDRALRGHPCAVADLPAGLVAGTARASRADFAGRAHLRRAATLRDSLLDRRVQFLLCHAHPQVRGRLDGRCRFAVVGRDTLLPVAARVAHRGDDRRPKYELDDVSGRPVPLLAFSAESGMGRIVAALRGAALEKAGAATVFTAHLATVLKSMALDGRGVAWLPRSLIEDDLRARRLVTAAPNSWRIDVEIRIYRPDAPLTPAAEAFWDTVAEDERG